MGAKESGGFRDKQNEPLGSAATFFARLRVGGNLIRKSLRTDVLFVAKLRLADTEKMSGALLNVALANDTIFRNLAMGINISSLHFLLPAIRQIPMIVPAQLERPVRLHGQRQPDMTRVRQIFRMPLVADENKSFFAPRRG